MRLLTVVSQNLALYDYVLGEKSLAVFVIFQDNIKCLQMPSRCCQHRCSSTFLYLQHNNSQNFQFASPIHRISIMEIVQHVPSSRLHSFIKFHLLLWNTIYTLWINFGDHAYHPAWFVPFSELPQFCIFFILFLILPFLLIMGICKIARTISDSIQHLFQGVLGLSDFHYTNVAFLFSCCTYLIAVSITSTHFLATAVSISA
jgi:hypothetical protein